MTQRSGKAAMSVVMYVVTPSIRLDGTNAYNTHRSRLSGVTTDGSMTPGPGTAAREDFHKRTAHKNTRISKRRYPFRHCRLCSASVIDGSNRSGYPSKASRLPALLA